MPAWSRRRSCTPTPYTLLHATPLHLHPTPLFPQNPKPFARLVASQEGARTIIFTGSFMHDNAVSQRRLASAFRYWSNGDSQALFMKHEGYVGALGALAMSTHQMLTDAHGHRR